MNSILEEAAKLSKSAPNYRGGIIMGLQLVLRIDSLTSEQIAEINQTIDIISGATNYRKPAPRPEEIKKIEKDTDEAINTETASEPEANTLPRREDPLDTPTPKPVKPTPPEDRVIKEGDQPKPKIRRPWDKDPNTIRRPKR